MPGTDAPLVAVIEIDAERALVALADETTLALYGIRWWPEPGAQGVLAFHADSQFVWAITRRSILRRALPPAPAAYCRVRVETLLSAARYRGPGPTSPMEEAMRRADPARARQLDAIGHGDQHVQCRYRVSVQGRTYAYVHVVADTFHQIADDAAHCRSITSEVEARVRSFTEQCLDLRAGEYWGYRLDPL